MGTATRTRTLRVIVDLLVEDDIWEEHLRAGCTDKYLVGEVKKSFRLITGRLWRDAESRISNCSRKEMTMAKNNLRTALDVFAESVRYGVKTTLRFDGKTISLTAERENGQPGLANAIVGVTNDLTDDVSSAIDDAVAEREKGPYPPGLNDGEINDEGEGK